MFSTSTTVLCYDRVTNSHFHPSVVMTTKMFFHLRNKWRLHIAKCKPSNISSLRTFQVKDMHYDAQENYLFKLTGKKLWSGRVIQVVEHLPSKCEALGSNPSTAKKKENAKIYKYNTKNTAISYHKMVGCTESLG
jgi:hypothetical protein